MSNELGYGEMVAAEISSDQPTGKFTKIVLIRFDGRDVPGQDCVVTIVMNRRLTQFLSVTEDDKGEPAIDCYD